MNGLFKDTLAELFDKKTVYLFLFITLIGMIITIYSGSFELSINGSSNSLDGLGFNLDTPLLLGTKSLFSFFTFLVVMMSAGILPNMFIKGRADYFLSKPLSRKSLILKKFVSVWIIYGVLVAGCGLLCYVTGALVHGTFNTIIFTLTGLVFLELFIWLSISFLAGIYTGKSVSVIMILFVTWVVQYILHWVQSSGFLLQFGYEKLAKFVEYLYYIFPKFTELSDLFQDLVIQSTSINSYVLYSTVGFAVVMLYSTLILFERKNY